MLSDIGEYRIYMREKRMTEIEVCFASRK